VKEAVASAPDNGKTRYVIYVKKGTYKENVEVGKKKKNVMLVGDGMDSTIITGSLNVVDGSTTFNSATVGKDLTPLSFSLFLLQIKSSPFLIIKSMSMVFFFQLLFHFI
jgi:pectin methylesterase-like acyl-CoA thioesterase